MAARKEESGKRLAFADEVAAAERSGEGRMYSAGGNVAAVSGATNNFPAVHEERHLAFEDEVSRVCDVAMLGILLTGAILPNVGEVKAFGQQGLSELGFVHGHGEWQEYTPILEKEKGQIGLEGEMAGGAKSLD